MSTSHDEWFTVKNWGTLPRTVKEDAYHEPENPRLREKGCRMVVFRSTTPRASRKGSMLTRILPVLLLLGATYKPYRAMKAKTYAIVCPDGLAVIAVWLSIPYNATILTAVGDPDIIAEEVKFHNPIYLVTAVEQCETLPAALRRHGIKVAHAERKLSGEAVKFYICAIDLGEKKKPVRSLR